MFEIKAKITIDFLVEKKDGYGGYANYYYKNNFDLGNDLEDYGRWHGQDHIFA